MACASKASAEHGGVSVDVRDGREVRLYDMVDRPEIEPTKDERERERCMGLSATKSNMETVRPSPTDAGQWPNREPPMEPAREAGRELGAQLGGRRRTSGPPSVGWTWAHSIPCSAPSPARPSWARSRACPPCRTTSPPARRARRRRRRRAPPTPSRRTPCSCSAPHLGDHRRTADSRTTRASSSRPSRSISDTTVLSPVALSVHSGRACDMRGCCVHSVNPPCLFRSNSVHYFE